MADKKKLPRTRAALKEYDRTQHVRDVLFQEADNETMFEQWAYAVWNAQDKVCRAYAADTGSSSVLEECRARGIEWLREQVAQYD